MNPAIKHYLDEHGATYTPEALRKGLLDAGYDPAEVDAALAGWNAADVDAGTKNQRTFRRWALWLHVGALVAVFLLIVVLKGTSAVGAALTGCAILAVALLIGWAISSFIGRALLPATGAVIALIVPALSALLLAGSCFSLLSMAIGTPPRQGTVSLELEAPRAFEGSGGASCYVGGGVVGAEVSSGTLGTLDGEDVSLYLVWYPGSGTQPAPASETSLTVTLDANSTADRPETFSTIFSTTFDADASPDGLTGTLRFEGLASESEAPSAPSTPETISGTVSWDCK